MNHLLVSEIFGPTIQGEGPTAGRRAAFLRLGLCNLDCTWCDTPYTWDWTGKVGPPQDRAALLHLTPGEVAAEVRNIDASRLVVTGGEPLVQQRLLVAVLDQLPGWAVEVETNGTVAPSPALVGLVIQWNVSPKLPHSGVADGWRQPVLDVLLGTGRAAVKVVCRDAEDVAQLAALANQHDVPDSVVWVMPEGRTAAEVQARLPALADAAVAHGFNLSTRLHVHAWGNERGR